MFDYYYGQEAEQFTFYRIPKILFTNDEIFGNISTDAKLLYGLMLDRMSLSIKNNWFDDKNRVYIIFTIENIMEAMKCGKNKAINLLKEISSEGIGLIEKVRQGLGKPNLIYVKDFMSSLTLNIDKKRTNTIKQQINYNHLVSEYNDKTDVIDTVVEVVSNTIKNNKDINISGSIYYIKEVKKRFKNIKSSDVINILTSKLIEETTNINELKSLIFSRLYFCIGTRIDLENNSVKQNIDLIKAQIDYKNILMLNSYKENYIDEIVNIMAEVKSSKCNGYNINNEFVPINIVKDKFSQVTSEHIEYILSSLEKTNKKIRNIRNYLISTIYNSISTINYYYAFDYNSNQGWC